MAGIHRCKKRWTNCNSWIGGLHFTCILIPLWKAGIHRCKKKWTNSNSGKSGLHFSCILIPLWKGGIHRCKKMNEFLFWKRRFAFYLHPNSLMKGTDTSLLKKKWTNCNPGKGCLHFSCILISLWKAGIHRCKKNEWILILEKAVCTLLAS